MQTRTLKLIVAVTVVGSVVFANPAQALGVVRYVDSTAGNCSGNYSIRARNCTGSDGSSYSTVAAGVAATGAGDTLYIRAGTYDDHLRNRVVAGPSSTQRTVISAYDGEAVVLRPSSGQYVVAINDRPNIAIVGLVLDAANATVGASHTVVLGSGSTHVLIDGNEIRNSSANGVLVSGEAPFGTFRNNYVHHNGDSTLNHGLYLKADDWVVEDNRFERNSSMGAQFYPTPNRTQARRNVFANNCTATTGSEVMLSHQSHLFENNVVYTTTGACTRGVTVNWQGPANSTIRHNTIYSATGGSTGVNVAAGTNTTVQNNLVIGYSSAVRDDGIGTRVAGIVSTGSASSHFEAASSGDFALRSTSGAIDMGINLAEVTTDFLGAMRPAGEGWDAGAFEFGSSMMPSGGDCDVVFGHLPAYELCAESAGECEVALETRGTCTAACAVAGRECVTGYIESTSACAREAEVGCDTTDTTQICVCALDEAPMTEPDAGATEPDAGLDLDAGMAVLDAGLDGGMTATDAGMVDSGDPSATCWLVEHTLPDGGRDTAMLECEYEADGCAAGGDTASGALSAMLLLLVTRRRRT